VENIRHCTIFFSFYGLLLCFFVSEIRKTVRTELCLEPGEFDLYNIGVGTSITFCLREFRALLSFAEAVNLPVTANFDTGGR